MVNWNGHGGAPGLAEIAGTWVTPRVDVLGVGVSAIDMPMTLHLIDQWISTGRSPVYLRYRRAWGDGVAARPARPECA